VPPTAVPPNPPVASSLYRLESNLPVRLLGLQVAHATPDLRRHYGAPSEIGVLVTRSEPGKPADLAGVRVGDVLTRLGELEIGEPEQLERSLLRWNWKLPLELTVVREGEPRVLTLSSPATVTRSAAAAAAEPDSAGIERSERELLESKLRTEIKLLERRIEQLKRDLERLREEP
jgi:predicted metalloprotease with PDZ domain